MINRTALLALAVSLAAALTIAGAANGRQSQRRLRSAHPRLVLAQPDGSPAQAQPGTPPASATAPDVVVQWNQELQKVLVAPGAQPSSIHPTRTMAIVQIAVYDAVNGILRQGQPFLVGLRGPRDASAPAAAASAARTALDALLPSQATAVDAFFQTSLAGIGSGRRVDRGVRFGERVADAVLAARASDGTGDTSPAFTPGAGPGEYQLTPPAFAPAGFTQTAHVTPFVLESASQFRPAPPPALTSAQYAQDFAEVHDFGELNSPVRTPDETALAKFWGAAPVWVVWNQVADQAAQSFGTSLERSARTFALLDTTLADEAIALYDAKYAYHRWRPITAITAVDQGNPNTTADPAWLPLANTANDPSYPGAHAAFSQAAATVLQDVFATDVFSFSLTNATVGITRTFSSFSQAAAEAFASRIFAGQHFRSDENAGRTLGAQVADWTVDHAFGSAREDARAHR